MSERGDGFNDPPEESQPAPREPFDPSTAEFPAVDREREAAKAPVIKPNQELYSNASLLELGISDLKRIDVESLKR